MSYKHWNENETVYQVERTEPLPVDDIKFPWRHDDRSEYVYSISAVITGRRITSGEEKVIGSLKAHLLQMLQVVMHKESLW
jgi:hypothetical protein